MSTGTKPYVVRTDNGTFVSEHDGINQAEQRAARANKEAERLGLQTRYKAEAR